MSRFIGGVLCMRSWIWRAAGSCRSSPILWTAPSRIRIAEDHDPIAECQNSQSGTGSVFSAGPGFGSRDAARPGAGTGWLTGNGEGRAQEWSASLGGLETGTTEFDCRIWRCGTRKPNIQTAHVVGRHGNATFKYHSRMCPTRAGRPNDRRFSHPRPQR